MARLAGPSIMIARYTTVGAPLAADMKTYAFKVLVEPDESRWHAHCPVLQSYGASTWGATRAEAYKNIQEVVEMIVQELREDGIAIRPPRPR